MYCDWMQWIPCILVKCIPIKCSGLHAASLNAVDSMHCAWMQCNPCSVVKCIPIECSGFYAAWLNAVDSCSMIECSGCFAAWPKASRLNAVDFRQHVPKHPDWMQWIPCSMIEWSGFLQHEWMQWIFCSMSPSIPIECHGFHAAWWNASWLNAVYTMQRG